MLNYEGFKKVVAEEILSHMPEQYQYMQVVVQSVQKVNCLYDSLSLVDEAKTNCVSPSLNLTALYATYSKSDDIEAMLDVIAENMERAFQNILFQEEKATVAFDCLFMPDRIVFQLVNTEKNGELLKKVPYRQFLDLSLIYRYVIATDGAGITSAVITNKLAGQQGMDEETLFKYAAENTLRILPPTVRTMQEVMRDMMVKDGMLEEIADMTVEQMEADMKMFVITNKFMMNGAATIMYEGILHDLAMQLDADLYILPSSLHEVIAIPTDFGGPCGLSQMVSEINAEQVAPEDRLSNSVYRYDRAARRLDIVAPGNVNLDACMGIIYTPDAD